MKMTTGRDPMAERYKYDFGMCSIKNGWAQIDTSQDASYYGNWCNPFEHKLFSFIEGDTTLTECDSIEEFAIEIRRFAEWNEQHGWSFAIDPGLDPKVEAAFIAAGLGDFLH